MACLKLTSQRPLALGAPASRAPTRRGTNQRGAVHVHAQGNEGGDWDKAWSSFQRQVRSQVDVKTKTVSGRRGPPPPPRRVLSNQPGGWGGQEGERIRKAERVLLDIWSSEDFNKAGAVASVALLLAFVLIVGPPPPDGRCSLYWC